MKTVSMDSAEGKWQKSKTRLSSSGGGTIISLDPYGSRKDACVITVSGPATEVDRIVKNWSWSEDMENNHRRAKRLLRKLVEDDWEDEFEGDIVLLHVSDWNFQDKYYEMPRELALKFRDMVLEGCDREKKNKDGLGKGVAPNLSKAWDWLCSNVDYGDSIEDKGKPIKYQMDSVNMMLEEYWFDYCNPVESLDEWELD